MDPSENESRSKEILKEASFENPRTEFTFFRTTGESDFLWASDTREIKGIMERQRDLESEIFHELWRTGRYEEIGAIVNSEIYEEKRDKIKILSQLNIDFQDRLSLALDKGESLANYSIFLNEFLGIFINASFNRRYDSPLNKAERRYISAIVGDLIHDNALGIYLYSRNPFDDRIPIPDIFWMRDIFKDK